MNRTKNILSLYALNTIVLMFLILYLLFSCKKIELERIVMVATDSVTNVNYTTCTAHGTILDKGEKGIDQHGFCFSMQQKPTTKNNKTQLGSKNSTGSFASSLTGLTQNTTYYLRAYATNSVGTAYGSEEIFTTNSESGGETGNFTDTRDSHEYRWVKIGEQVWMAENLAYLPSVNPSSSESNTDPYYYVYDYQGSSVSEAKATSNYATYGVLYNWPAAMAGASSSSANPSGVQGVCPDGWHVPSDAEWKELEMHFGMSQTEADGTEWRGTDEGGKLKETGTTHWYSPNTGATNESGFSSLPGGYRDNNGNYTGMGLNACFWSSAEFVSGDNAWYRILYYDRSEVGRNGCSNDYGLSVRCIRDK